MSKELEQREKIVAKYLENPNASFRDIGKSLKIHHFTVSRVINRFKQTQSTERQSGSGKKEGFIYESLAKKVLMSSKRNPNKSLRDIASNFGVSHTWVAKVLRRNGIKTYKVQKHANRNDVQAKRAKTRARKLYDNQLRGKNVCIIMDDETYVVGDFRQLPGLSFYRAKLRFGVKKQFKYKSLSKFPQKFLVWQAICSCGRRSKSYIAKGSLKSSNYISECLEKRLLPFIRSHKKPTVFWPDLATIHYSSAVLEWYRVNEVNFVGKDENPPNCPHLRPVETYWALVKEKLRKSKKTAKNYNSFVHLWLKATKQVTDDVVTRLMRRVTSKVREFSRQPIDS